MKLSCCCGLITGFVLALLCAGGIYYYFYCKENPGASADGMQKVESSWQAIKDGGDKAISTVKPFVVEQLPPPVQKEQSVQAQPILQLPPPPPASY